MTEEDRCAIIQRICDEIIGRDWAAMNYREAFPVLIQALKDIREVTNKS
jgi:hypothetical protein